MDLKALYKLSYGLYVISSKKADVINGQICNTVFQVTSEPPTVAISISKKNYRHEFISESRVFTVSVLSKDTPLEFIGRFGFKCGRNIDKFQNVNYRIGATGAPICLDNAVAYLGAEVINVVDCGTHTLFIGKIVDAGVLNDKEPMTYAYYHEVKRGTTPKVAPTYIREEMKEAEPSETAKYRCTICGYIYDPKRGDPDRGVKSGTPFEELPDGWVCPVCGATRDQFEKAE